MGKKYTLELSEEEKHLLTTRLRSVDRMSRTKQDFAILQELNEHRGTLLFVLTRLEEKEKEV
jgi:hypothetical protein